VLLWLRSHGFRIYFEDDGFYRDHQEFTGRIEGSARFLYSKGVTTVIEGDWETPAELAAYSHGTGVSSTALGAKVGAAPGARLFATFGVPDTYWLIKRGAKIINNSTSSFADNMMYSTARDFKGWPEHFLNAMNNSNTVMASAAGNESLDLSERFDRVYRINVRLYPNRKSCLEYPDEAENYLVVGDVNPYSNYPGHLKAFQDRFITIDGVGPSGYDIARAKAPDSYYIGAAGTSHATPLVSGSLAILLEINPKLTAVQAAQILLDTADRPASKGYGTTCSSTTPMGTFTTDCGAMKYGRGLMNVPKAIAVAKTM